MCEKNISQITPDLIHKQIKLSENKVSRSFERVCVNDTGKRSTYFCLSKTVIKKMNAIPSPFIFKQGTDGLDAFEGPPSCKHAMKICETQIRCVDVCKNGKLLAFSDNKFIKVLNIPGFNSVFEKEVVGVQYLKLSPKGTVLATWTPFRSPAAGSEGEDNLYLYDVTQGTILKSLVQKKMSRWSPQWSFDESLSVRHFNTELHFYENNDFSRFKKKLNVQKVADFSLSTNIRTLIHYVACYSVGVKGQPSFVRLYKYPNVEGNPIANKSFYKADSVTFHWNSRGDSLLLLCAVDVDKSGKSYYGEQSLHYLDISGRTYVVKLNKEGPVHNVSWTPSPKKDSYFCVVYGFLPAKAALFNCESEMVFQFGDPQMINLISFNPFGNLVALAGFGNLRGGVFVWDLERKSLISKFKCPETTDISWCPDGVHLMIATTSPRLRVGNRFQILRYNGTIEYSWPPAYDMQLEVYKVLWQPNDDNRYKEPAITDAPLKEQKKAAEPEAMRYVPPAMRKPGDSKPMAKTSSLSDVEKRSRNLEKKLNEIKKLKELRDSGKQLEINQLQKISKEDDLIEELMSLKLN